MSNYVDVYLLPVPEKNFVAYREQATSFGQIAKEHGALSYREFRSDDLGDNLKVEDGQMLTAAVNDPRVTAMTDDEPVADMDQMRYGGFETIVDV